MRVRHTPTETNFTETNLADILTKSLPRTTFERLRLLCQVIQVGDENVSEKVTRERVMYAYDLNTWMTKSV